MYSGDNYGVNVNLCHLIDGIDFLYIYLQNIIIFKIIIKIILLIK